MLSRTKGFSGFSGPGTGNVFRAPDDGGKEMADTGSRRQEKNSKDRRETAIAGLYTEEKRFWLLKRVHELREVVVYRQSKGFTEEGSF
ncbi:MAG: hypothetical protein PUB21_10780 [Bacteroidales bacterium]|nr:hypothetical protein [Bacteroidales bacterium]